MRPQSTPPRAPCLRSSTRTRVVDLPLNGRNAASLITLVAGVVDAHNEGNGTDQGVGKTFPAAVVTTTNGTSPQQSNYLLDGGNNVDEMTNVNGPFPFPDALQEFSVQTSNYNAEYGQSAGAVVNIITKSGGEKFHGDAFEFVRNGYFNAKPYFATVADNISPPSVRRSHRRAGHHPVHFQRKEHAVLLRLSTHTSSPEFKLQYNDRSDPGGRRTRSAIPMPISATSATRPTRLIPQPECARLRAARELLSQASRLAIHSRVSITLTTRSRRSISTRLL